MDSDRSLIAGTAVIHPAVKIGRCARVDDWVVLGYTGWGGDDSPLTVIGENAVIRTHSVVYAGVEIGDRFHLGHQAMIREFTKIGNDVSIGTGTVIEHHVMIGNDVRIHSNAFIPEFSILEDGCWVGPNVVMTNAKYPLGLRVKEDLKGPTIKSHAKIGANATLLPAVEIGEGALVGAASVVRKDVPPLTVVAGSPARTVGRIDAFKYEDGVRVYEALLGEIGQVKD